VLGWAYIPNEAGEPTLNINQAMVDQGLATSFQVTEEEDDE
jgi:hypothetical protein